MSLTREDEPRPLVKIKEDQNGKSAIECFHSIESCGKSIPCKEPLLLERYLTGKMWHGVTVENLVAGLKEGTLLVFELSQYPEWVANEVLSQYVKVLGWKPKFVETFVWKPNSQTLVEYGRTFSNNLPSS